MKGNLFFQKTQWLLQLTATAMLFYSSATAQTYIPMDVSHWELKDKIAEFITYKGIKTMKILQADQQVVLKDHQFTNGTIEFDMELTDPDNSPFVSFYFRQQSPQETECVYLRAGKPNPEKRNDAVQYAPFIKGINLWNMLGQYQGPANIYTTGWNHIKLVVSGLQLRVYINSLEQPTLEIPRLEGNTTKGRIALDGLAIFANLSVKPGKTEDLPAIAGPDLTNHDANYLRKWSVSRPQWLKEGQEHSTTDLPKDTTTWTPIHAERRGLINVTRLYGAPNDKKRYVWLKTTIHSAQEQKVNMQLGFCNDVWVYINGKLLYLDRNTYWSPMRKNPDGRCDLSNSSFNIPLKAGENQLLISLANNYYGWGIIARLASLEGIE